MQAAPAPIINFFNGLKQYVVPLFQRPYSWQKKDWSQLWEDLEMLLDGETSTTSHFMGAVVTSPTRSIPVGVGKHLVIDGQQRLTTLAIVLCALRDVLPPDAPARRRISNHYLVNDGFEGTEHLKILPTQQDRDSFLQLCTGDGAGAGRVGKAYDFFRSKIDKSDRADQVLTIIEQALHVVNISLDESEDPYTIFESLNFKGAPLTQVDLARNYFLMKFPVSEQEDAYYNLWRPVEQLLEDHMPRYLRQYLRMPGEEVRKPEVYAALRQRLKDADTSGVRDFLGGFRGLAPSFGNIVGASTSLTADLRRRLQWLNEWEIGVADPFIMRVLRDVLENRISELEAIDIVGVIESFAVRREVCAVPTNRLRRMFLTLCKNRTAGDRAQVLAAALREGTHGGRWPSDEEFREGWLTYRAYAKPRRCRLILTELESFHGHKEAASHAKATIEHIMPQTLTDWWRDHIGSDWREHQQRWGDTIGNLTLSAYNSELSNNSYDRKRELLLESNFQLNKRLPESLWREEQIRHRASEIASLAEKRWPRHGG